MNIKPFLPVLLLIVMSFKTPSKIDSAIENFSLINAIDNGTVTLSEYGKSSKVVVIVFSSPSCAFSKIYEERIISLAKEYQEKEVSFLLINPNNPDLNPDDNAISMAKRAKDKGYVFPFLIDNKQKTANGLGASKTPEAFVLKNINGTFVLKYKGAIDDNPQLASEVTHSYIKEAINAVLSNSPIKIPEKHPVGCGIRK